MLSGHAAHPLPAFYNPFPVFALIQELASLEPWAQRASIVTEGYCGSMTRRSTHCVLLALTLGELLGGAPGIVWAASLSNWKIIACAAAAPGEGPPQCRSKCLEGDRAPVPPRCAASAAQAVFP